jgi:hypothetical protein
MSLRNFRKTGVLSLLVVAVWMLLVGSVWASHDCCGHPSDAAREAGSGAPQSSDDDCVCACCQAETAISPLSCISFQLGSWWSVESTTVFAASRFETDIFRPPLA